MPTFHGFVQNSMDGLILFEACLSGKLHHVPRRPHDRERNQLIKSGSIFIYEENASGIKRWTDGVAWSPSRILGNFLIYRELEKPFPPGEKKRAMKRKRMSMPGEPYPRRDSDETGNAEQQQTPITPPTPNGAEVKPDVASSDQDKEMERSLIGSLVDSYGFRPDGLVKKTMSISINGISHHMVSYYKVDDVKNNLLPRPLSDPRLANVAVRPELYLKQNFRAPVEESEQYAIDAHMHAHPQMMYQPMQPAPYGMRPTQYYGGQQYPGMYSVVSTGAHGYGSLTGTSWPSQTPGPPGTIAYGNHPSYAGQPYSGYYKNSPAQQPLPSVKAEEGQATSPHMPYNGQYTTPYPGSQRHGSQSQAGIAQAPYQTPVQQSPASFGSVSSRPSYGGLPAASGQSHQQYGPAQTQQYAVRSPNESYAQPPPATHSPHPQDLKSPRSSTHPSSNGQPIGGQDGHPQMSYRSSPYAVGGNPPSNHSNGDMSGLSISGNPGYSSQNPPGQPYQGYAPPGQNFRPVSELGTAQGGTYSS